jgi:uncharacterized RDD family membrane protein YckC
VNPTHVMGRRVVAFIIDYVLLAAAFAGLFYALATHTDQTVHLTGTHLNVTFDRDTYYLQGGDATSFYVIELLVGLLYGGVIQGLTGGTIGKVICGIRVMREDGSRPGIGRGVLRWVLLIVDDFPYFIPMLTGFIVALSNERRRRVGDMAAGTFVVRAGTAGVPVPNAVPIAVAPAPPGAWPPAQDPAFGQSAPPAEPTPAAQPAAPNPTPAEQPTAQQAAEPDPAAPNPIPAEQPTTPQPAEPEPAAPEPATAPLPAPQPSPAQPPPPQPLPPANWYPDPSGNARLRYWDGARWTDHTAP